MSHMNDEFVNKSGKFMDIMQFMDYFPISIPI